MPRANPLRATLWTGLPGESFTVAHDLGQPLGAKLLSEGLMGDGSGIMML